MSIGSLIGVSALIIVGIAFVCWIVHELRTAVDFDAEHDEAMKFRSESKQSHDNK